MNRHADELRVLVASILTPGAILDGIVPTLQEAALALERFSAALSAVAAGCATCHGSRTVPEVFDLYHMTDHTFGTVNQRQRWLRRQPPRVHNHKSGQLTFVQPCTGCAPLWQVIETSGGKS